MINPMMHGHAGRQVCICIHMYTKYDCTILLYTYSAHYIIIIVYIISVCAANATYYIYIYIWPAL